METGPFPPSGPPVVGSRRVCWYWLCSSVVSTQLPPLATPVEVAEYLHTTTASLTQNRNRGTGPRFIKRGSRDLADCPQIVRSSIDKSLPEPTQPTL